MSETFLDFEVIVAAGCKVGRQSRQLIDFRDEPKTAMAEPNLIADGEKFILADRHIIEPGAVQTTQIADVPLPLNIEHLGMFPAAQIILEDDAIARRTANPKMDPSLEAIVLAIAIVRNGHDISNGCRGHITITIKAASHYYFYEHQSISGRLGRALFMQAYPQPSAGRAGRGFARPAVSPNVAVVPAGLAKPRPALHSKGQATSSQTKRQKIPQRRRGAGVTVEGAARPPTVSGSTRGWRKTRRVRSVTKHVRDSDRGRVP